MTFQRNQEVVANLSGKTVTFLAEVEGFAVVQRLDGSRYAIEVDQLSPLLKVGDRVRVVSDVHKVNIGREGTVVELKPEAYYGISVHRDNGSIRNFHYSEVEKIDVGLSTGA